MKIAFKNSKILMINGRTLTPMPGQGPEPGLHYVYTSSEGHGSISASPMSGKKDTLITLSNTPDQNYIFSKYTLNNVDLAGSSFLMPDEDAYVRGYFQPDVRTITVTQPSHGTITAPASAQIGSTVTLSCTPESGYEFQYFTVNGSQIQGNSFVMPASNVTVSASIAAIEYMISVTQPSHGVITAPASATTGSTVTLSCTPATGYSIDHFTVDGVQIVGNSFTMPPHDVTISASVTVNTYTISITQATGGTISAPQSAQYGSLVILSSTADSGYELQNYTVDGVEIQGNTFTMPAHNVTVSAVFEAVQPPDEVTIGTQTWKTKNLAIDDGGSGIYHQTVNYGQGDVVEYYYTYEAAERIVASIPGWHLPTYFELENLQTYIRSDGRKLKSTYGWKDNGNGTDDYGFSGFPAGLAKTNGDFSSFGNSAYFWQASEYAYTELYYWYLWTGNSMPIRNYAGPTSSSGMALSVRLIKD